MCPDPADVRIPFKSLENVTLKTSCEKALVLRIVFSSRQSQMVSMKSGDDPKDASISPLGLKRKSYLKNKSKIFY